MTKSKIKKCKYLSCDKEVPSDRSLFCIEHSRSLKEKGRVAGASLGSLAFLGATVLANSIIKKKV